MNPLWKITEELIIKYHGGRVRPQRYGYLDEFWNYLFDDNTDLIVLKAPTGIGKTEAVLVPYLSQYLDLINRYWFSLIHVLPTQSLVNAMFKRISNEVISLGLWGKVMVTLDYGDPLFIKPYLEGDIVITTYDTLVYTLYGLRSWGRHYRLPLGKISNSLIIMDEVQLLQDVNWYSPKVLAKHIDALLKLGAKVVVMSATVPDLIINELLSNSIRRFRHEVIEVRDEAIRGNIIVHLRDLRGIDSTKAVMKQITDLILELLGRGLTKVLCVFNTIGRAVELFKHASKVLKNERNDVEVILLHSRLRRGVRYGREVLLDKIKRLVLISTQVVEAGMDYNFDLLITDVSPIDSLIQRLGRLARRAGDKGEAIIILDEEGVKSSKAVYGLFIERALELLGDHSTYKLLSDSVKNVSSALELVNRQYTKDLISKLSKRFKGIDELIRDVRSFIERFSNDLFKLGEYTSKHERYMLNYLNYLIRLGLKVRTIYPEEAIREKINELLSSKDSEIDMKLLNISLLSNNSFSISIRHDNPLPKALVFTYKGKDYIITLNVKRSKGEFRIKLHKNSLKDYRIIVPHQYYVINPKYYEFLDNEDIGVVKLR